ncbi:cell division protein DivIVA [Actinomyces radicidentis]|uniref:Cell wall synthesis protein Wag31 n=1 Tax=Actinomyces radicidentis TaxID=111015 RepID=A0A0X8JFM8_ACTRD|nr:DivIVA domain-containing protein [Actinomyces radicidentis]AMD87707.1 cell division protein DivIVA [Actinomyces radicidentis]
MTLLADDVLNKKFTATKFREGYEQDEVDEFLDEVVEAMRQLEAENADLKAKLEAANARVEELSEGGSTASAVTPVEETSAVADEPAEVVVEEEVVEETAEPVAETSAQQAAPVAAAPVAAAAPAAASSAPTDAAGMLELAQRLHDEHVANGKAEEERLISEAKASSEQILKDAEDQRNRTLAQLEKERSGLEHKIDELRRFESDYRTRLKSYLNNLLTHVEDGDDSASPSL